MEIIIIVRGLFIIKIMIFIIIINFASIKLVVRIIIKELQSEIAKIIIIEAIVTVIIAIITVAAYNIITAVL